MVRPSLPAFVLGHYATHHLRQLFRRSKKHANDFRAVGDELQRLQTRLEMPPQSTILEASTLRTPFYHNGELVKMNDGMGAMFMVAAGPGELSAREFYPLTGESTKFARQNKAAKLLINQGNAGDYLRFFMTFLRTGEGESFKVIESLSGYALVNDEKPEQRKPEDMRLVCYGVNADDDAFAFRGYVAYANELFGVSMRVHKNGDVEMLDDDPLGRIVRLH
jgi:hypothetical protein